MEGNVGMSYSGGKMKLGVNFQTQERRRPVACESGDGGAGAGTCCAMGFESALAAFGRQLAALHIDLRSHVPRLPPSFWHVMTNLWLRW